MRNGVPAREVRRRDASTTYAMAPGQVGGAQDATVSPVCPDFERCRLYEVFAPSYTKALKLMLILGALVFGVLPA
jgi:hypothetical protein